jgi:hypothetical protein
MFRPVPLLPFVLITGCAVLLALLTAVSARRGQPWPDSSFLLVRHSPVFRWTVLAVAILVPVGLTIWQRSSPPLRRDVPLLLGAYLSVAAVTSVLVWEAGRFYLLATPTGVEGRSAWRGLRAIEWDDLEVVRYRPLAACFEFRGRNGGTIRVPAFAAGLDELLRRVEASVPPGTLVRARAGYARLGRPFPALPDEPVLEARRPRA